MQHVKTIKTLALIEGVVKNTIVTIEYEEEDASFENFIGDLDRVKNDLERRAILCVWVRARASFPDLNHFEGSFSKGQVTVRGTPTSAHKDLVAVALDHDLIRNAISDLVCNVLNGKSDLNAFLGKVA